MLIDKTVAGQYTSVAEFSHEISGYGWPIDCRQLDCGTGRAAFEVLMSDNAILQHVSFERRTQQLFCSPNGFQSYGLPSGQVAFANVKAQHTKPEGLLVRMEAEAGVEAISEPGFSAYTLSFSTQRIAALAENLGLPDPGDTRENMGLEIYNDPAVLNQLKTTLSRLFESLDCKVSPRASELVAKNTIESEIPAMLLVATSVSPEKQRISLRNRERVLKRALDYIESRPQEALSIESLCVASASSISTLERAFLERYSISPKRFMLVKRLHHVHKALLAQSEAETRVISEVANQWGFWHMGKFAADYRKFFGYLPSQTRKSDSKSNRLFRF